MVSALVPAQLREEVVRQHAEEAAFLAELRDHSARSPVAGLDSLAQLEARLDAHGEALRLAGEAGWEIARPAWTNRSPGDCSAALRLGFALRSWTRVDELLASLELRPEADQDLFEVLDACVMAVAGLAPGLAIEAGRWWLTQADPLRWSLGLACLLEHRVNPGAALERGFVHPAAWTRAVAYRGAAMLGLPGGVEGIGDPCARVRVFAIVARLRQFGPDPASLEALIAAAPECPRFGDLACALGFSGLSVARVDAAIARIFAGDLGQRRLAYIGAVGIGEPMYITWVIESLRDPAHGLAATYALTALTGLDPDAEGLIAGPPAEVVDGLHDYDIDCPWLDLDRTRACWHDAAARFPAGRPIMFGVPVPEALRHALLAGPQRLRALAAWRLALLRPGAVFAYDAPGARQRRWLAQLAGGSGASA